MSSDEKRAKIDENAVDFSQFRLVEVLSEVSNQKWINLLVERTKEGDTTEQAIVKMEKKSFDHSSLDSLLKSIGDVRQEMCNGEYSTYNVTPAKQFCDLFTTVILPADATHIAKARQTEQHIVYETPEDYKELTLPFVEKKALGLQWVYNLLEHKAEVERIIFEDPCDENGFILAPDMKWDRQNENELYLTAVVRRRGIRSIRDLTASHLPLLLNLQSTIPRIITKHFSVAASRLRIYLHYQPSFYHLHVHCVHIEHEAYGQRVAQAVMLQEVIDNITLVADYYQRRTLPFTTKIGHPLYEAYNAAGKIM